MDIFEQVRQKKLICPRTGAPLSMSDDGTQLLSPGGQAYRLIGGRVPILLPDETQANQYIESSNSMGHILDRMSNEYSDAKPTLRDRIRARIKNNFWTRMKSNDYRSAASIDWFQRIVVQQPADTLLLNIGGGPSRPNPNFFNVNIGPFPDVDMVADAHQLPYADGAADAAYSEAVFEHLYDPARAAREMFRILKPGGLVLNVTPFLHEYHGYPHHYCNFTLTGHQKLFENAGFELLDSGTCVGPMHAVFALNLRLLNNFAPSFLKLPMKIGLRLIGLFFRPLDKHINARPDSHILAATTYVAARKPESPNANMKE